TTLIRSGLLAALLMPLLASAQRVTWRTSPAASVLVVGGSMMNGNHFADSTLEPMRKHYAGARLVALVPHASHPDDRDRMVVRLEEAFEHLGGVHAGSLPRHDRAGAIDVVRRSDA